MLHQEQYRTDPSSLESLYIMLHLTPQRPCEHSSASKLTFCPLKDYHFDRIHKTLLCLVLTVSYFGIFTNGAVRKCRWGGQWNAQTNPCSPGRLSDSLPSILHTVEVSCGEWALGWSWRFMQPHSAFISSWKADHVLSRKTEKEAKTQKTVKPRVVMCGKLCVRSIFNTAILPARESLNLIWNMQSDGPKARNLRWTYLLRSHAWSHTTHTYTMTQYGLLIPQAG